MPRVPLLLISLLAAPHALAQSGEAWTGQLTSYAWGSGLGGQLTPFTGGPTLRIDKSFAEVLEDLDGAAFVSAFARRDRLVLLGDLSHARSSKAGRLPPGLPASGRLRQSSLTLAAGWRVHDDGRLAADLLGGLRRWDLRSEVAVPAAGLARSPSESFTDPLLAARANLSLSPRWSLVADRLRRRRRLWRRLGTGLAMAAHRQPPHQRTLGAVIRAAPALGGLS